MNTSVSGFAGKSIDRTKGTHSTDAEVGVVADLQVGRVAPLEFGRVGDEGFAQLCPRWA